MSSRKEEPVYSGVYAYFPRAIRAISRVSKKGNDKHNVGEPLHWNRTKSTDQPDAAARHLLTPYEVDEDTGEYHLAHAAWRTLAWLEMFFCALEEGLDVKDFQRGRVDFAKLGAAMEQRVQQEKLVEIEVLTEMDNKLLGGCYGPESEICEVCDMFLQRRGM